MKHKSQSVSKLPPNEPDVVRDARVRSTRNKINEAFVKLLFNRSYGNLRVSDIARKAAIGRATFYAHFSSKDELLRAQVERVVIPMLKASPGSAFLLDCRALFAHVRAAPQLFRAIMSEGGGAGSRLVRDAIGNWLDTLLPSNGAITGVPTALTKRYIVSTLLTIISHGLQPGASDSAEEMQNQFEKLVGSGLSAGRDGALVAFT